MSAFGPRYTSEQQARERLGLVNYYRRTRSLGGECTHIAVYEGDRRVALIPLEDSR